MDFGLGDLLEGMLDSLGWVLRWFLAHTLGLLWQVVDPMLAAVIEAVPAEWLQSLADTIDQVANPLEAANFYVPVSEAGMCLTAYWIFLAVLVSIKYILKLIPGMGG